MATPSTAVHRVPPSARSHSLNVASLRSFYRKYAPAKVGTEEAVLRTFAGREIELLEKLERKYVHNREPSVRARRYADGGASSERARGKAVPPKARDINLRPVSKESKKGGGAGRKSGRASFGATDGNATPRKPPGARGMSLRSCIERFRGPVSSPADRRAAGAADQQLRRGAFWWQEQQGSCAVAANAAGGVGSAAARVAPRAASPSAPSSPRSQSPRPVAPSTSSASDARAPTRRSPQPVDDGGPPPRYVASAALQSPAGGRSGSSLGGAPSPPAIRAPRASRASSPLAAAAAAPPLSPAPSPPASPCGPDSAPSARDSPPPRRGGTRGGAPAAAAATATLNPSALAASSFDALELRTARLLGTPPGVPRGGAFSPLRATTPGRERAAAAAASMPPRGQARLRLYTPAADIAFEEPAAIIARLRQRLGLAPPSAHLVDAASGVAPMPLSPLPRVPTATASGDVAGAALWEAAASGLLSGAMSGAGAGASGWMSSPTDERPLRLSPQPSPSAPPLPAPQPSGSAALGADAPRAPRAVDVLRAHVAELEAALATGVAQ